MGAFLSVRIEESSFNIFIGVVLLCVALMTGLPVKKTKEIKERSPLLLMAVSLLLGFHTGMIHAGYGILAVFIFSRIYASDLIKVNSLKMGIALATNVAAFPVYAHGGDIHWPLAASMALGNLLGGIMGVHFQIKKGGKWVRRGVIFMGFVLGIKILLEVN